MGAQVLAEAEGGRCPITLKGAREPAPILYRTPVASAQIKSAVLLAGLNARGVTTVDRDARPRATIPRRCSPISAPRSRVEPEGEGGASTSSAGRSCGPTRSSCPPTRPRRRFPIVAALITPGSDIVVEGVMTNPLRTGLLTTLIEMGADIDVARPARRGRRGGRRPARAGRATLTGVDVPAARAPSMIDEYPILAVAAAFARGTTRMRGLHELRVKESDRLAAVAAGPRGRGRRARDRRRRPHRRGRRAPKGGGLVATHLDHRIAMSFLVMGLACRRADEVDDAAMIATSFPEFPPG